MRNFFKGRDFIECNGDYRNEAFMEDPFLPLYAEQRSLPRLPVPDLEETMATFLPTALPFCKTASEQASLEEACRVFPEQAATLQKRLLTRRKECHDSSWLQAWWTQLGYMAYREPLFHVSFYYRLEDDDSCHGDGLSRAASALQAAAIFGRQIQLGQRQPDKLGRNNDQTLCSTQFKYVFNACRIPHENADLFRIYSPEKHGHVAVAVRGRFYKIPLFDTNGKVHHVATLRAALEDCERQSRTNPNTKIPEMGWLTTSDRDTWATNYALLCEHAELQQAMHVLQSAFCVLALDVDDFSSRTKTLSPQEVSKRFWHGNRIHSANRWMDKSFHLVVTGHGQFGYVGEHSMADGLPAIELCKHIMDHGRIELGNHKEASQEIDLSIRGEPIFDEAFEIMDSKSRKRIQGLVNQAKHYLTKKIRDHDLNVLVFSDYGADLLQKAGFSPDAFVQVAMQLAGYKLFGGPVGTYEATQTRKFLHGRTETTRSVSSASQAFVQAMLDKKRRFNHKRDNKAALEAKKLLLKRAIKSHTSYTKKAVNGLGVDRHFFGLSMLLQEGERPPDLFQHSAYLQSKRWRLTTSCVPRAQCGFSMVENDGIGIGYDVQADYLSFSIVGRTDRGYVNRYHRLLHEALQDMKVFLDNEPTTLASENQQLQKQVAAPAAGTTLHEGDHTLSTLILLVLLAQAFLFTRV